MDRGLHVVADMETELGTDPRASSHGEQRQKARRRASQRLWTRNTGCFPRGTDRWARSPFGVESGGLPLGCHHILNCAPHQKPG